VQPRKKNATQSHAFAYIEIEEAEAAATHTQNQADALAVGSLFVSLKNSKSRYPRISGNNSPKIFLKVPVPEPGTVRN
jgi:hypothetical protein